jgi:hypothetical protein
MAVVGRSVGKVSLYLSSDQTEQLYGIKTDGLYYVRDGMVNQYAMTFQHQVYIIRGIANDDFIKDKNNQPFLLYPTDCCGIKKGI